MLLGKAEHQPHISREREHQAKCTRHTLLLLGREEKEMRAGWSKNDFGSECTTLHAMDLESLLHPHALGQMNFCHTA